MMEFWINAVLLGFLFIISIAIQRIRNLFAAIMLTGIFSLLCAAAFVTMDAVDVAFTEAAVGAGISTVLFLGALALIGSNTEDKTVTPPLRKLSALGISLATGLILFYATLDMPKYGDIQAPPHQHVAPRYLQQSAEEVGLPNVVTSVFSVLPRL